MKRLCCLSVILAASFAGDSFAACGDPALTRAEALALLEGHTVCVSNGNGGWKHQEQHVPGGDLVDYKRGENPFDPTQSVGSWDLAPRRGEVRYTYGGVSTQYSVHGTGDPFNINPGDIYSFCGPQDFDFTVRDSLTG